MNFQGLGKIGTANMYLDQAFRQGRNALGKSKTSKKTKLGKYFTKEDKSKKLEGDRVEAIKNHLVKSLEKIHTSYPKFREFDPFYKELTKAVLNLDAIRVALAAVKWAEGRVVSLTRHYHLKIKKTDITRVNTLRNAYMGRISSIIKQIGPKLKVLEEGRKILKRFPAVKTQMPTAVLAGYPNVGKSSLLRALTGSDPEINSYPFTTKRLMMGYIKKNRSRVVQIIDSPGVLDRIKKNYIEEQAVLAIKHLARVVVYVFDLSETCGYKRQSQEQLLRTLKKTFRTKLIIVFNKEDLIEPHVLEDFKKKYKDAYVMTATKTNSTKALKQELLDLLMDIE